MIDFSGFPDPENTPEPGACVRLERPEPELAVLVLDPPHRKLAVLDAPLLRDLDRVLAELERGPTVRGVVITGRTPGEFAAGADVEAIEKVTDPRLVVDIVHAVHELLLRIERFPAMTVAAVGGAVPGGAFELSLACDRIVASDDPKTRIGLPETQLGIVPAWGGCHRLPARVGVPKALQAILTGRLFRAPQAKRLGLVDRLTKPEYLVRIASEIAMGREVCKRRQRGVWRYLVDKNPIARAIIVKQSTKQVLAKTRGHYPAPLEALQLVAHAPSTSIRAGADKEAQAASRLAVGPVAKSLISIFFASEAAKKRGRSADGSAPRAIERAGVIGAGIMGGGIAGLMAERGVHVRLSDLSGEAVDAALLEHRSRVEKSRKRRRLAAHEAAGAVDRLDGTTTLEGFGRTQLVIEAIAERLDVKRKVFGELAKVLPKDTILATNTSSLSVDAIAKGLPNPSRVVGMHFFNPVHKMPLVEVVRGKRTSAQAAAEVAALALRLGKTPVVVADVAGFLVNRILGPYLDEAVRLFVDGADPAEVDRAMLDFGMPMGPFLLLDEVGFDIAAHASQSLHEAYGERMAPSEGLADLASPERLGKKTGCGFYRHPGGGAKPELMEDLPGFRRGDAARALEGEAIIDRLVLAMLAEGARCLEEKVVETAQELDLATVFGMGFAPFRGGLLRYADSLGAEEVAARLERIRALPDVAARGEGAARFATPDVIARLAAERGRFHAAAKTGARESVPG